MERQEYKFIKPFLDISEFVMISVESQDGLKTPNLQAKVFEEESSLNYETISVVDFLTPLCRPLSTTDMEHYEDFQLQSYQVIYLNLNQQIYDPLKLQTKQENVIQTESHNRNLLDLIEEEYERKIQQTATQLGVSMDQLELKTQKSVKSQTNDSNSESAIIEGNEYVKYYNLLTFRENNIQFSLFQRNSRYFNETRKQKVQRFFSKKIKRNWNKKIAYYCRKQIADSRLRIKGRFIKRKQADILLGLDTSNMQMKQIRSLLQTKFQDQYLRISEQ